MRFPDWLGLVPPAVVAAAFLIRRSVRRRREEIAWREWMKHADGPLTDPAWDERR